MSRILRLVKGPDGQVRGAQLKVLLKAGKQTTLFRPLQKFIPFEIGENRSDDEDTANEGQLVELPEEPEHDEESSSEKNILLLTIKRVEGEARERRPSKALNP